MKRWGRCILLAPPQHRLTGAAIVLCAQDYHVVIGNHLNDEKLAETHCDLLVSFLSDRILPGSCLKSPNVNFHPAPPRYPGRGGASYAIFDGADEYGATAHVMHERVDAGPILLTEKFGIEPTDTCESLFERAEDSCLSLLEKTLDVVKSSRSLPPPNGEQWSGAAKTRKQFDRWLVLDPSDSDVFSRKIKAAVHTKFPGPYVELHGHKFALVRA